MVWLYTRDNKLKLMLKKFTIYWSIPHHQSQECSLIPLEIAMMSQYFPYIPRLPIEKEIHPRWSWILCSTQYLLPLLCSVLPIWCRVNCSIWWTGRGTIQKIGMGYCCTLVYGTLPPTTSISS